MTAQHVSWLPLRTINFIPKGDCKEQKVKMDCKRDRLYNLWESVQSENGGSPCSNTITHFMTVTAEVAAQAAQPRSWPWPQRMWLGTHSVHSAFLEHRLRIVVDWISFTQHGVLRPLMLTGYDSAQIIFSLKPWASSSIKEVKSNQFIGLPYGLTEKTYTKDSEQSLSQNMSSATAAYNF